MLYTVKNSNSRTVYFKVYEEVTSLEIITKDTNIIDFSVFVKYSLDNGKTYSDYKSDMVELVDLLNKDIKNLTNDIEYIIFGALVNVTKDVGINHTFFGLDFEINKRYLIDKIFKVEMNNKMENSNLIARRHDSNLYNPYRQSEQQKELQNKLSYDINMIWGHEIYYFKSIHNEEDMDITFKEFKKGHVNKENCNKFKIMIVDNFIPENKTQLEEFDMFFEREMEIHIDKALFAEFYGDEVPNSDDFFFLPINRRMYRLNAPHNEQNFMVNDPFYKMKCTKWEKRSDIKMDDFTSENVDTLIGKGSFVDEFYEDNYQDEKDDAIGDFNLPKVDFDDDIKHCELTVRGITLFKNYFDYDSIEIDSIANEYSFENKLDEFTLLTWYRTSNIKNEKTIFTVNDGYNELYTIKIIKNEIKMFVGNDNVGKTLTEIKGGIWYSFVFGYKKGSVYLTLLDSNLEHINTIVNDTRVLLENKNINKICMFGNNHFSNIRVNKRQLTESGALSYIDRIMDINPKKRENYIIDNAIDSIKTK